MRIESGMQSLQIRSEFASVCVCLCVWVSGDFADSRARVLAIALCRVCVVQLLSDGCLLVAEGLKEGIGGRLCCTPASMEGV